MGTIDLFISDPLIVDLGLFGAWLEGLRVDDAVQLHPDSVNPDEAVQELVLADCSDQFRLFWMLQPYLMDPSQLAAQRRYRMLPATRRLVLDAYYGFDERVMRELIGRKPTAKLRRELESQREKLNVSLRSCRRQFDNLQRLFTALEEYDSPGDAWVSASHDANATTPSGGASDAGLVRESARGSGRDGQAAALTAYVRETALLSEAVALRYVHVSFLCTHCFEIGKRRVLFLTFTDWEAFASILLEEWTAPGSGLELDPELAISLRQLKGLIGDAKLNAAILGAVQGALEGALMQVSGARSSAEIKEIAAKLKAPAHGVGGKLKAFVKRLSELGGYLSNSKDLKDFFVELVEVTEWLRSLTLTAEEASVLIDLVTHALPAAHFSAHHIDCWKRFMRGASDCMRIMYARVPGTSLSFLGP
tara:strand:- start:2797 stop:4056 length:1260 start_codon:yes stop_codon:yes gene_type:complete